MKFQIKVEYGQDELVKFYTEADVVNGIIRNYSFSSLVEDIRRTCEAATSHVQHFANTIQGRRWRLCESKRGQHRYLSRDVCSSSFGRWRDISENTSESQWARFTSCVSNLAIYASKLNIMLCWIMRLLFCCWMFTFLVLFWTFAQHCVIKLYITMTQNEDFQILS